MTTFVRLLAEFDKEEALRTSAQGADDGRRFTTSIEALRRIPTSPFAYWVPDSVRDLFENLKPFEDLSENRTTKCGLGTCDDFRFVRLIWEIQTSAPAGWKAFYSGGRYRRFYDTFSLRVNWEGDGRQVKAFVEQRTGSASRKVQGTPWYFLPGFVFPYRTPGLAPKAMPADGIFTISGQAGFTPTDDLMATIALLSGPVPSSLIALTQGRTGQAAQFQVGQVARVPFPSTGLYRSELSELGTSGWRLSRLSALSAEHTEAFVLPAVLEAGGDSFEARVAGWAEHLAAVETELARVQREIDELCFELYGISEEDRKTITGGFAVSDSKEGDEPAGDAEEDDDVADEEVGVDPRGLAAQLVSWVVGVGVGRFDVRFATGERERPAEPDPFDPLPVCSPGMLTGEDGLPLDTPQPGYPVDASAVLVTDPGHPLDITARVRSVFDVVFGDGADRWWADVGEALGARGGEVGEWLAKGFFDHHLKTYSKSRRKAPILWPIGTASGSYLVWLYAHRVTGDSLFQVLHDMVTPKIALEDQRLTQLRQTAGPSPTASQRREIDKQAGFVDELRELAQRIEAMAPIWAPDLNDGIVIVLAPFWQLFSHHRGWSRELKNHWTKLAAGHYDWAQLAMHLWPERVVPKCAEDRSLAIAHNLEDVFWVQDSDNPAKWHPRQHPITPIEELVSQRHNTAVTAVLKELA